MRLLDFHGKITKCSCTNSDPKQPMDCRNCQCRGYVAECLGCGGKGQITVPVAGAQSGDMKSTCSLCGGIGHFPSNAPAVTEEALQPA